MKSALLAFFIPLLVFVASPVLVQTDSVWTVPVAASVLREGDLALDEFGPELARRNHYGTIAVEGRTYYYFPNTTSLVALPVVWAFDQGAHLAAAIYSPPGSKSERRVALWESNFHGTGKVDLGSFIWAEHVAGSFFAALAALFVFLTARRQASPAAAWTVTLLFAFGTTAYSTASRVLWQHGPSMAAVAACLWILSRPRLARRDLVLLGAVVGLAYTLRPTNSLTVLGVTSLLAIRSWRQLPWYFLGALVVAVPFVGHSLSLYGSLLPPYFLPQRLEPGASRFWEALAGNLLSPARGLFVFSPFLVFALAYSVRCIARGSLQPLEVLSIGVITAHWLAISAFPHWWGGHSVGPRFFTDVLPCFAVLLLPPVARILAEPRQQRPALALLVVSGVFSVLVHTWASVSYEPHRWNDGPPSVDEAPNRLWDVRDLQFLRGL